MRAVAGPGGRQAPGEKGPWPNGESGRWSDGDRGRWSDGDWRRRASAFTGLAVATVLLFALATVPAPVTAHVNDVNADPQVSADGTVVIETVFIGADGWVVIHRANGTDPGEPIGHAAVSSEGGLKTDVPVEISRRAWRNWSGARTVWAVLHEDDGDGEFEPSEDETIDQFGEPAGQRFAVRAGERPAYVTARGFTPQKTDNGTVTVRTVALPEDGYVVVRNATDDGDGQIVARTALPVGTSKDVSVELDDEFFRSRSGVFTLRAVAYTDDGDGSFDGGDEPVRVGSSVVGSRFGVEKTGGPTPTPTSTPTHGTESDGDEHGTDHHNETDRETGQAVSPTSTPIPTPPRGDATATTDTTATTPGFGLVGAFVALVGIVVLTATAAAPLGPGRPRD